MKEQIEKINGEISELLFQINNKRGQINKLYASCKHNWTEPQSHLKKIDYGYGSHGGSYDVREWERECKSCGKVETTHKVNLISVPDFDNNPLKINIDTIPSYMKDNNDKDM